MVPPAHPSEGWGPDHKAGSSKGRIHHPALSLLSETGVWTPAFAGVSVVLW